MLRSSRAAWGALLAFCAAAGGLWVLAAGSNEEVSDARFPAKMRVIGLTGDRAVDAAARDAVVKDFRATYQQSAETRYQKNLARHLQRRASWEGSQVRVTKAPLEPEVREVLESVKPIFETDLVSPESRLDFFQRFFQTDGKYRCVGWRVLLRNAIPDEEGWLVDVEVESEILGMTPRFIAQDSSTYEIWRVTKDGRAEVVSVKPGIRSVTGEL
ncbi:MAG: hypothetical protein SH850_29510 [Planctomycetaceae bacterium]|nr:hypothetical protein [Planctomycetaceae bacterium]